MNSLIPRPYRGFSIIEFMIAITLGAMIVVSASSIYLSNKTSNRLQEELSRLQENARFANYYLNHELRMAGFQGCASESFVKMTNLISNPSKMLTYDNPLLGYDGLTASFSPTLPSNLNGKALPGTDAIEVRKGENINVQLKNDMNQTNNPILVYDRLGIQAGDVLMISNCLVGDIFIAGGNTNASSITHSSSNNTSNNLSVAYTTNAYLMRYSYYAFYIKNTGRVNSVNQPVYALVRQDANGNEDEIVEGVEQMRIRYGIDTDSNKATDTYQTATEVTNANNWNKVISIKINLLFATNENVSPSPQVYKFNGATYTPTDRKLRREWESYVTIRNRGLPS